MKPIEQLNNYDSIYIELFGKRKKVEVFSTGDNKFDETGHYKPRNFALSEKEIACLNWFIENVKIEDYRKQIAEYVNDEYDNIGRNKHVTEEQVEKEIKIFAIAVNISKITKSKDGFVYPEIGFYGDCKANGDQGICIGFRDKKFLGIDVQAWIL